MLRRIAPMLCAVVLVTAVNAWAQTEIRGVVRQVDPSTRTVYFTDGRTVQLKPGSVLTINGQPVLLEAVRPGATLVMLPPGATTTTTVTTVTQQTQPVTLAPVASPPMAVSLPPQSPVNVTGTIARTDPLSQTITFQDGRIVKVAPHTMVWQQSPAISSLLPGTQVFVRDAVPVGYVPTGAAAPAPAGQYVMGTVARVEPGSQQIVLSNGAVVYASPATTFRSGSQRVMIGQLRPGDEVLIQVRPASTAPAYPGSSVNVVSAPVPASADRYAGSALPYQGYADTRIEASDVVVVWSPQAR